MSWDRVRLAAVNALRLRAYQAEVLGRPELRRNLANAHSNLGVALYALGEAREALGACEAGLALLRALVEDQDSEHLRRDLAQAQVNHGLVLAALGRDAEALAAYDSSVELLRPLTQQDTDAELHTELARAYLNRSSIRSSPTRLQDAEACRQILQGLAGDEDRDAFDPNIVRAYLSQSNILLSFRDYDSAVQGYEAAIGLLQPMRQGEVCPEAIPELALAHANAGVAWQELGKTEKALEHFCSANDLLTELVERRGLSQFRSDLARTLLGRGGAWQATGCLQQARIDIEAGVHLMRQVVAQDRESERTMELARGLAVLARLMICQGERRQARRPAREAMEILRAQADCRNVVATPELFGFAERVLRDASHSRLAELVWWPVRRLLARESDGIN
jgi:tetratricopeptide (TPR) repeat protein